MSRRKLVVAALSIVFAAGVVSAAVCAACQGSGTGSFKCSFCNGTGSKGQFKCSFCNGKGFVKCGSCNGTGQR